MADWTVEGLINQGLRDAGLPLRVEDVYEGSEQARVALEIWGQTRDELLRTADWSFSRRTTVLSLLKGPPPAGGYSPAFPWSNIYPAPDWLFEYDYPSDCLDVRAIIDPPSGPMPDLDPRPAEWRVDNDLTPIVSGSPPTASGPAAKVIYCNISQAMLVYRARVTDISEWDTGFMAAMISSLGTKYSTAFGADVNSVRQQREEAVLAMQTGADVRG
jgi:hypothetical protein